MTKLDWFDPETSSTIVRLYGVLVALDCKLELSSGLRLVASDVELKYLSHKGCSSLSDHKYLSAQDLKSFRRFRRFWRI